MGALYLRDLSNHQFFRSEMKIFGGVAVAGSSAYLMGSAVSENGWDFTSAYTYHAMISGMLTGGQLASTVKSAYRKYKTSNKIKPSKEVRTLAEEVIGLYRDLLKENKFSYSSEARDNFNDMVKSRLEQGNIPNSALSVVITNDRTAFVAFSGNKGPGLIFSIDLKRKEKSHVVLDDNSLIGNRKVALNDDREINDGIIKAIEDRKEKIKKINIDEFIGEKKKLEEFLLEKIPSLTKNRIKSVITNLQNEIKNKGYIEEKKVDAIFKEPLKEIKDKLKNLNTYKGKIKKLRPDNEKAITSFEKKIIELEQQPKQGEKPNSGQTMSGEKRIKILEQKIDELQQEAEETSKDLEKFYKTDIGISWNRHFKKFRDKFTHWDPRNCAEPHVITSLSRSSQIFPSLSSDYNLEDIRYLATYKLTHNDGLPQLTEFPRCDHCVITTRPIRNIITDPYWLDKIFDLEKKLPGLGRKQDLYKQRLYFLTPYYDMLNRLIKTNVTNDREGSISARGRRSAFDELAEIEIISNEGNNIGSKISTVSSVINQRNDHYATNVSEGATNSAAKSSSIINNLFSWVKSSIGGLLSSKSVGVSSTKDSISQVDAKMDVNGTIMLLDLLIRKVTGQKYVSKVDHSISPIEAQGYALNITKGFEKVVEQAGLKSGVSMHRLNIDFVEIQKEVTGKIMSGKFNEISGILKLYIEKACPSREAGCPGKLSSKKFDKFMAEFNSGLNVVLNQSIEHNGDGRLEVDGAKQMSLEPQSYLSNASVQGHSKVSTCLSEIGVTKLGGNLNR